MSGIARRFSFHAALPKRGGFAVYARLLEEPDDKRWLAEAARPSESRSRYFGLPCVCYRRTEVPR